MTEFSDAPLQIGQVVLTVHDLDRMMSFYEQAVGLHVLEHDAEKARLGAGERTLLELRRDPHARSHSSREAGLFHTAFLLPTRPDLGRWARHAAGRGIPIQGASDHLVSEAIYLADPEGNGIEIYADRPRAAWLWSGDDVVLRTDPLDVDDLMRSAGGLSWHGVPQGTVVGHVHLQVGALAPADEFYGSVVGFAHTARYPGASFFGTGGYHHHLATNIWNSRGAPVRSDPATGLAGVEIVVRDPVLLDALRSRAVSAGHAVLPRPAGLVMHDPWGTCVMFSHRIA